MRKLGLLEMACMVFVFSLATVIASVAQVTFTTLANFSATNGAFPSAALVQGFNGNFYGTTAAGGANCGNPGCGTVFSVTTGGVVTRLHSFAFTDGGDPVAGLVQGVQGNLLGTTYVGGLYGPGTVFRITPSGTLTTLHSFDSTDGSNPGASLVQGSDGNFYGTTFGGGSYLAGTVFRITPAGALTTFYSFCPQTGCADGASPDAGLVQGADGTFYGTTLAGGANSTGCTGGCGTIFKMTPTGQLTTLYSFCAQAGCSDGASPAAGLVQGTGGNFYGTTRAGGAHANGTVFRITPTGTLTTLYSFCAQKNCSDGAAPDAGLVQGTDGNFYGTTNAGGAYRDGTIFRITPAGTLTKFHSFNGTDGKNPVAALVQGTDGKFYGTASAGGANCGSTGCGTIFSLDVGLGPFVETLPASGKVGAAVTVLGTNLTGATTVAFNGTAATFNVISGSEIKTTVPTGATTGTVQVITPSGTLNSNVTFRVKP